MERRNNMAIKEGNVRINATLTPETLIKLKEILEIRSSIEGQRITITKFLDYIIDEEHERLISK